MPKPLLTSALLVDRRDGSEEFIRPLKRMGAPATKRHLDCADFAFDVKGPQGLMSVGVERKTISEMLGIKSRRRFVGSQLPKMIKVYDIWVLIIEGWLTIDKASGALLSGFQFRARDGCELVKFNQDAGYDGARAYEVYQKALTTLSLKARLIIIPTHNKLETTALVHAMFHWGLKDWHAHSSAFAVESLQVDRLILDERTMRRQTFAQWPGVGWKYSAMVSEYFPSVKAASLATAGEWRRALKIKTGTKRVMTIIRFLNGMEARSAKA